MFEILIHTETHNRSMTTDSFDIYESEDKARNAYDGVTLGQCLEVSSSAPGMVTAYWISLVDMLRQIEICSREISVAKVNA